VARFSDYPPRPVRRAAGTAEQRGWGHGWPQCQRGRIAAIERAGVKVFVRKEIAPLVATLLEATEKRHGYDIKAGQTWGYACRPIRGTQTASNHSWGLAVDINSLSNPMGATFKSDMPPAMVAMWWACGFYWGGWYSRRPDAMHFEYLRRPGDVAADLATARRHLSSDGRLVPVFQGPVLRLTNPLTRGERVRWVQDRLNAKGASPKLTVDGIWGLHTDEAFRAFQKRAHLTVDGVFGPRSHAVLAA
jgi:D-alanyl-D-alanine carboxypeptidase/Putative peptidoglycan binding domain